MTATADRPREDAAVRSRVEVRDRLQGPYPTSELVTSGWVVAVDLAGIGEPPDRRYFAVGVAEADKAVEAVLLYPGLAREDRCIAIRRLSPEEISRVGLRARAVRPYGEALKR